MIKILIVILVLLLILMLIALRYRRQIQQALQIWRMYRQIRQQSKPPSQKKEVGQKANQNETLVRCARCGKWIAPETAVKLRGNTIYCSTTCMEKAARLESLVDKK